ncbi:MAG: DUF3127 domain-containing protein [Algoriphagus sp.]|uniref:DUF3127 domain-containing protein n=1 Tax=Algoriphagus sp. TaxID=1872435 RepID=UPI0017A09A7A|nr:DUF3127 domain-containing protein [Algoriphagus sp.]NVJ87242.1 DUF3127 domain-containing protein [Algoriphagus sp.]
MELSGKVIQKLQEVSGNSKSGNNWRKQEFIIETPGNYPKKVCVALWGDKIDQFPIAVGEEVKLSVDVESREYNGRWYTDIKAYRVDKGSEASSTPTFENGPLDVDTFHADEEDQLPF